MTKVKTLWYGEDARPPPVPSLAPRSLGPDGDL